MLHISDASRFRVGGHFKKKQTQRPMYKWARGLKSITTQARVRTITRLPSTIRLILWYAHAFATVGALHSSQNQLWLWAIDSAVCSQGVEGDCRLIGRKLTEYAQIDIRQRFRIIISFVNKQLKLVIRMVVQPNPHKLPQPSSPPRQPQLKDAGSLDFYDQFCKLYLANKILLAQLHQLETQQERLLSLLDKTQKKGHDENVESSHEDKKKRIRRTAGEIQRHYLCKVKGCNKSYGSQGSLNQHMRFKHGSQGENQALLDVKEEESNGGSGEE